MLSSPQHPYPIHHDHRCLGGPRMCARVRRSGLLKFRAAKAQCYLPRDKHRLLAAIESSFGTLPTFDALIHDILRERHSKDQVSLHARVCRVGLCSPSVPPTLGFVAHSSSRGRPLTWQEERKLLVSVVPTNSSPPLVARLPLLLSHFKSSRRSRWSIKRIQATR
jgi:hypothetical protein